MPGHLDSGIAEGYLVCCSYIEIDVDRDMHIDEDINTNININKDTNVS